MAYINVATANTSQKSCENPSASPRGQNATQPQKVITFIICLVEDALNDGIVMEPPFVNIHALFEIVILNQPVRV